MFGSHPRLAMPKVQLFCVLFGFRPSFGRHRFFYVVLLLLLVERVVIVASVTHFLDATVAEASHRDVANGGWELSTRNISS